MLSELRPARKVTFNSFPPTLFLAKNAIRFVSKESADARNFQQCRNQLQNVNASIIKI